MKVAFLLGLVASIITIFGFITGNFSIASLFTDGENDIQPKEKITERGESKILTGNVTLGFKNGFSFLTESISKHGNGNVVFGGNRNDYMFFCNGCLINKLGAVDFDSITEAPIYIKPEYSLFSKSKKRNYFSRASKLCEGDVYCLVLGTEGYHTYVKIIITDITSGTYTFLGEEHSSVTGAKMTFKYVIQKNGSNRF